MIHKCYIGTNHRIECEIRPKIEGPMAFLMLMDIETSDDSIENKEERKKEIDNYYSDLKRKEKFNKIVYWIPRKTEEIYWRIID